MNFHNIFRSSFLCSELVRFISLRLLLGWHKPVRKLIGRALAVALFTAPGVVAYADTALGAFAGDPADTWDGLKQAGVQVRTFEQAHLLNKDEKVTRRYLQYVPRDLQGQPGKWPLVIALHGANLNAEAFRELDLGDRLERLADKEKFILVYANAYGPSPLEDANPDNPFFANGGYWRTCFGRPGSGPEFFTVDDVEYLRTLIAQITREGLAVDRDRVYLMGSSNGGEMAQRAARSMGGELAGVGAVMTVNAMPATVELFTCPVAEQEPVSMMFIYSPKDILLQPIYAGFGFSYAEQMSESLKAWRTALGIDPATETVHQLPNKYHEGEGYSGDVPWALASMNSTIKRYDYARAPSRAGFAVLEINDTAGHAWPNYQPTPHAVASQPDNGFKNQDIQAEEELWSFLKQYRRIP